MSNTIGRFEILSELAKSDSGSVYKASDPESGQTLALKVMRLDVFGEYADEVVQRILQEAESTKDLSSPNITLVYGAGEIDGQFCAAMEYVQGNSIATMLARREGFSIWDLLDISRQVCQGLDYAHQHNVFHYSLEPAKVMVTWDGTVKILSLGISSAGYVAAQTEGFPPPVLHYMSPEQVRGEKLDARSNLFTWGAMLYEMVTDQKAFPGEDAAAVRQKILEADPVAPAKVNPKINPVASEVIMKALAKDPAQRYASGPEMAAALEACREVAGKGKKAEPAKGPTVTDKARAAAAAAKFASAPKPPVEPAPKPQTPPREFEVRAESPSLAEELETSWVPPTPASRPESAAAPSRTEPEVPAKKASAAAASWSGGSSRMPSIDPSAQFMSTKAKTSSEAQGAESPSLSAPVLDEPEVEKPKIAVDPMMAESSSATQGRSFSDLEELPPLKEVYIAPPAVKTEEPAPEAPLPSIIMRPSAVPEKPKVDPREVAEKAIKEIKGVPPKLMIYSISAAVAVILVIAGMVAWRSYSQSTDEEGHVPRPRAAAVQPAEPAPAETQTAAPTQPEQPPQEAQTAPEVATTKAVSAPVRGKKDKAKKGTSTVQAPVATTGELSVDSTPEGAQLQIDGRADAAWVTPYSLSGLVAGTHSVVVSKSGYGQESHTVEVTAGNKVSLSVHLVSLSSTMSVSSDPAGANIFVDGKDSGKVTPAQVVLEKGIHTILVRKTGYLDETTSATGAAGQTFHFAPTLRALGNADDIKTVGKIKKLFGGNSTQAGMGKVSVKTNPKGAQIAVNRRMLDKGSPVEFLLNPGNYVIDITATGYKPVQKVINVDKDGVVAIDETLQAQ
jgi:serine/threonine-protein kinase